MRRSLRMVVTLVGFAAACGVASIALIERRDHAQTRVDAEQLAGGAVDAGREAIRRYGCGGCHRIEGVDGADGVVGPSLKGLAVRGQIAGRLANRPDNLILWIRFPQRVDPGNGMPDLSVSEGDARDIAAFLYTLR